MSIRLTGPVFANTSPTVVQSIAVRGSTNAVFGGVAQINSGTSTGTVVNVDVRTNTAIFLGSMFTTAANSGFGRATFAVTSMTVATPSNSGAAGFVISTTDSLGAGTTVRIPWMAWRIGE